MALSCALGGASRAGVGAAQRSPGSVAVARRSAVAACGVCLGRRGEVQAARVRRRAFVSLSPALPFGAGNAKLGRDIEEMRKSLEKEKLMRLKKKDALDGPKVQHRDPIVAQAYRELAAEDEARRMAGVRGERKSKAFFGGRRQKKIKDAEKFEKINAYVKGSGRKKVNAFHLPEDPNEKPDLFERRARRDYEDHGHGDDQFL